MQKNKNKLVIFTTQDWRMEIWCSRLFSEGIRVKRSECSVFYSYVQHTTMHYTTLWKLCEPYLNQMNNYWKNEYANKSFSFLGSWPKNASKLCLQRWWSVVAQSNRELCHTNCKALLWWAPLSKHSVDQMSKTKYSFIILFLILFSLSGMSPGKLIFMLFIV